MAALYKIKAVFFDLDGTLLDTAHDLADATNYVLKHHGYSSKSFEFLRPLIGRGTNYIVSNAFNIDATHPNFNRYKQELLQSYQQCLSEKTRFFPGMEDVLDLLDERQIAWGVVTSKPTWLAKPLMKNLGLDKRLCCLVGRECLPFIKPHPIPILYACRTSKVAPQFSVYVGDTEADIIAAKYAETYSIIAAYGYAEINAPIHHWGADHIVDSAWDLHSWIKNRT